jgi:acetamidase/formamidase
MIHEPTRALTSCPILFLSSLLPAADSTLKVTPQTIAWRYYWSAAKPVLTVHSGDTVTIETVSGNPERLEQAGWPADQIPSALRTIYKEIPQDQRGPGGHLLTGPVAIEGAEAGDVLEVRIREIRMDVPFAYNTFRKGSSRTPSLCWRLPKRMWSRN